MPDTLEVKKAAPARSATPDIWQSFRGEMDRLFDRFSSGFGFPSFYRMFDLEPLWRQPSAYDVSVPAVDVIENDKAYVLSVELPGLSEKDVDVSLSGNMLVLKGEKRQEWEEKEKNRYVAERSYGAFQRSFRLPEGVDAGGITAACAKGVLTVTIPKTAQAQTQQKKIEIKSS